MIARTLGWQLHRQTRGALRPGQAAFRAQHRDIRNLVRRNGPLFCQRVENGSFAGPSHQRGIERIALLRVAHVLGRERRLIALPECLRNTGRPLTIRDPMARLVDSLAVDLQPGAETTKPFLHLRR